MVRTLRFPLTIQDAVRFLGNHASLARDATSAHAGRSGSTGSGSISIRSNSALSLHNDRPTDPNGDDEDRQSLYDLDDDHEVLDILEEAEIAPRASRGGTPSSEHGGSTELKINILHGMFPELDLETITTVLDANGGDVSRTAEMFLPTNVMNEASEEERRPGTICTCPTIF
jgi:hypothetical protein